jgi:hypothetical protein
VELRDLIVAPFVLAVVYAVAYVVRPMVTDEVNRVYYFPALTLKIIGAIALGTLYQFYYKGGDTLTFHTHGSRHVWEAFMDSPLIGLKLLFANGEHEIGLYRYSEQIWQYRDQSSYFIIRIAAVFDLFTFSSYWGTAILFAVLSFCGGWMLYQTFYKIYPLLHAWVALSIFFVPSIIFWGSGILKDTVTLAFLGVATSAFYNLFMERRIKLKYILLLVLSFYVIFSVKKYILISFLAAAMVWVFLQYFGKIRSYMLRILLVPFVAIACAFLIYVTINKVVSDDPRYALDKLAQTARITAYDIRFMTGKDAGSGYSLGELDGSFGGTLKLAPKAINVSLFRPYFWEVRNPLMVLSALESLIILLLTCYTLFSVRSKLLRYIQDPLIGFCLLFALVFAFGVGVSTYNFGTLARYKIPLIPFYMIAIGLILNQWNNDRNVERLD